jgi:HAE1 family hydrophobic/amphiphilic exporter-1
VPLSIIGPVAVLTALKIENNLYVQIGIMLLIALSAKNAILIVEVARERHAAGVSAFDAAIAGARARFRPILMTSFAFILSWCRWFSPPARAPTPASPSASPCSPVASTLLAVLFVPSFFVVVQRIAQWRAARRHRLAASVPAE